MCIRDRAVGSQSKASTASGVAGYNVNDSRTDKYGALAGKALTSTLGAFAVGNETNTDVYKRQLYT